MQEILACGVVSLLLRIEVLAIFSRKFSKFRPSVEICAFHCVLGQLKIILSVSVFCSIVALV